MKPIFGITKDEIIHMEDYGRVNILKHVEFNEVVVAWIVCQFIVHVVLLNSLKTLLRLKLSELLMLYNETNLMA